VSDLFDSNEVLLSAAQIVERVKEFRALEAQIVSLQKETREMREWFGFVAKVIGPDRAHLLIGDISDTQAQNEPTSSANRKRPGGQTWTGFIENYVNSVNRPVDYAELREAISNSVLGPKLEKSDKSFYGAIGKLVDGHRLVKDDGWVFAVAAYNDYKRKVAKGEIEPLPPSSSEQHGRGSRHGDEIKRFLRKQPEGASGKAIIEHMLGIEEFREAVQKNNTSVYNVLSRLVKRGEIRKIGTTYYHPPTDENKNSGSQEDAAV
jgi:hypothetical protein